MPRDFEKSEEKAGEEFREVKSIKKKKTKQEAQRRSRPKGEGDGMAGQQGVAVSEVPRRKPNTPGRLDYRTLTLPLNAPLRCEEEERAGGGSSRETEKKTRTE